MELALLQEKNLVAAWKQKDTRRSKKRKKNIFSGKKLKRGISNLDLSYIFLTLITGLSKVVLLFAFSYGLFSGYRFITQSPQFDVNRIILVGHKQLSKEELNLWIGSIIGENIFQLELDKITKSHSQVFDELSENGISVNLHYIPVHTQPYYKSMGFSHGDFPNAEAYYSRAISTPIFQGLSFEMQDQVVETIKKVLI